MAPIVDGLKSQYEGVVEFRLLNVERDPAGAELANEYGAMYVPTFVFLNSDGSKSDMVIGEVPAKRLTDALDALR